MHQAGSSVELIAARVDRDIKTVAAVIRKGGIKPVYEIDLHRMEVKADLLDFLAQGLTPRAIAARLGMPITRIYAYASRAGVALSGRHAPANKGQTSPRIVARRIVIADMLRGGATHAEMRARLGISHSSLCVDIKAIGMAGVAARAYHAARRVASAAPQHAQAVTG
jgi:hypothetical protein